MSTRTPAEVPGLAPKFSNPTLFIMPRRLAVLIALYMQLSDQDAGPVAGTVGVGELVGTGVAAADERPAAPAIHGSCGGIAWGAAVPTLPYQDVGPVLGADGADEHVGTGVAAAAERPAAPAIHGSSGGVAGGAAVPVVGV